MRGWALSYWRTLPQDERTELVAYDELERERRTKLMKDAGDKLNTETLLAWLFYNG